jgi:hypothetical protein
MGARSGVSGIPSRWLDRVRGKEQLLRLVWR